MWRYSWWLLHVIRSLIYAHFVFPYRRRQAQVAWEMGIKPTRLYFMMTTFKERKTTTEQVLTSICRECEEVNVPIKLFIGVGTQEDKIAIREFFDHRKFPFLFELRLIQQKLPGKRFAIGETLRAMVAEGLQENDPVIFMDGDTFFMPGCLKACLPFFYLYPQLQALTTHEKALVYGAPKWMQKWLEMRFIQRDFTMQSYALSNKVLTLTGRMSIFRGKHLLEPGFIDIIENDHLTHWLWGRFRFLSGDDKSTWYYLLKKQAQMFYIPDATTVTIEYIEENPFIRMKENLKRWSGNTLRNGARALALGPKQIGFFIWWCLVDQRIAIWNMPIGLIIILVIAMTKTWLIIPIYLIWIAFSRLCLSSVLFYYGKRIDITFPFIIYLNQLVNSFIKIYILFRLPQQRWKNRGDQKVGFEIKKGFLSMRWIANYLTIFYLVFFLFLVLLYLDVIKLPTFLD